MGVLSRICSRRFWLLGTFLSLVVLLASGCADNSDDRDVAFQRSVQEPVVEKRCPAGVSADTLDCYLLVWRDPIDTAGLLRVHVWLDTLVVGLNTDDIESKMLESSIKVEFAPTPGSDKDSLFLTPLIGEYLERDSLNIALWAEYKSGDPGLVRRARLILGDDMEPSIVSFSDSVSDTAIVLHWLRPTDQTDYYKPDSINGPIVGYNIHIESEDGKGNLQSTRLSVWKGGEVDSVYRAKRWRAVNGVITLDGTTDDSTDLHVAIRDSKGFSDSLANNDFRFWIRGLRPESRWNVTIVAYDSAGNSSQSETRLISLTDSVRPLLAHAIRFREDTLWPGMARLDSNRVILVWHKSMDPLRKDNGFRADSVLVPPNGCREGSCWREVKGYTLELWSDTGWMVPKRPRSSSVPTVWPTFAVSDSGIVASDTGSWAGDTLFFRVPRDTLIFRLTAVDSSGYTSVPYVDTVYVTRGIYGSVECPLGMVAVHPRAGAADTNVFCISKFEESDHSGFLTLLLGEEARSYCEDQSIGEWTVDLCDEDLWLSACLEGGQYGVIQEPPFYAQEFLFNECNVGTDDSSWALDRSQRSSLCTTPSGVRDMPGQLQEWALYRKDSVVDKDTLTDTLLVLKGSSYLEFDGADRTTLAKCNARAWPFRTRPGYTQDTVWLYKNGTAIDTSFSEDTTRTPYAVIPPKSFRDTLRVYEVHNANGDSLGMDYVSLAEYRRKGGDVFVDALAGGLDYQFKRYDVVFLRGTTQYKASSSFFRDRSIGFRCCATRQ